jgi:hypothetical protein
VFKSRLYPQVGGWATFLGIGMFTASDDDWQSYMPRIFLSVGLEPDFQCLAQFLKSLQKSSLLCYFNFTRY